MALSQFPVFDLVLTYNVKLENGFDMIFVISVVQLTLTRQLLGYFATRLLLGGGALTFALMGR